MVPDKDPVFEYSASWSSGLGLRDSRSSASGLELRTSRSSKARQSTKRAQRRQETTWDRVSKLTHAGLLIICAVSVPYMLLTGVAWAVLPGASSCRSESYDVVAIALPCAGALLTAPGALWLVLRGRGASWHLRLAAVYATMNWLLQLMSMQAYFFACLGNSVLQHWEYRDAQRQFYAFAWVAVLVATIVSGCRLTMLRLRALEQACLLNLHTRQLEWCFRTAVALATALAVSATQMAWWLATRVLLVMLFPPVILACILVLRAQWRSMQLASAAIAHAPDGRDTQAREMYRALRKELLCTVLMAASSIASVLAFGEVFFNVTGMGGGLWMLALYKGLSLIDGLCNEWYALHLSGAASGALTGSKARAAAAKGRSQRWQRAKAQWSARLRERNEPEVVLWDDKVCELAGRGISLDALLGFFKRLPSLMEAFDPARHSTNDVVRGAIIPFSATERAACATVLMGGEFTLPDKMVTHNWSNLFRDLMAAILADALGENDFSMVASLLVNDMERLERWVASAKVGGRTYWVCAFAVNQHMGICSSVRPNAKDTVTGRRPTACTCGLDKALNNTEPLLPDGRSIPCEMNKFDDMMKFLSATDPAFEQVLAIDATFGLFSRAWCVAEIAAANEAGMAQRLKIHSEERLSQHTERLRVLRIQDMEASRPEDKRAILESISDLDNFNQSLQKLLFEDLFPEWTSLDAEERMASAGAVIRWLPVWAHAEPVESNLAQI